MTSIKFYSSYNFVDKDPVIDILRTVMQEVGIDYEGIHVKSGVAVSTLHNWFEGKTKRPQYATVEAAARAMGKTFKLEDIVSAPAVARVKDRVRSRK